MKKLMIGLLALTSICAFAQKDENSLQIQIDNGLPQSYIWAKVKDTKNPEWRRTIEPANFDRFWSYDDLMPVIVIITKSSFTGPLLCRYTFTRDQLIPGCIFHKIQTGWDGTTCSYRVLCNGWL